MFAAVWFLAGGTGCGGEKVFTPEEFVEAANAQGAGVVLGPMLTTSQDGAEIFTVTLIESATGSPSSSTEDFSGNGTLLALDDAEAASAEVQRCATTASLVCFRAANAVLRFEGLPPAEQDRLTRSIEALATD